MGFVSSAFPDPLKLVRDRQDRKHEFAILHRQTELQKLGHQQRLEEIEVQADIAESKALYRHDVKTDVKWVDALRGTVRPVITYAFFLLFAAVKGSALYILITVEGMLIAEALPRIWDQETQTLWAAVVSFWFGSRTLQKMRQGR